MTIKIDMACPKCAMKLPGDSIKSIFISRKDKKDYYFGEELQCPKCKESILLSDKSLIKF